MNDVFLSIKEFANIAKVSPQAVYKRLDKDLKKYFKVIDGKKSIKIEALNQFDIQPDFKPTIQPVDNQFKPNVQPVDNRFSTTLNPEKPINTAIFDQINPKESFKPVDNQFKPNVQPVDNQFSTTLNPEKPINTAIFDQIDSKESFKPVDNQFKPTIQPVDNQLTTSLNQTLKILSDQLFEKDKQIAELNERLKEANELNRNNQILIGRQQEKPKQIEEINQTGAPVKKFFWDRFRKGV